MEHDLARRRDEPAQKVGHGNRSYLSGSKPTQKIKSSQRFLQYLTTVFVAASRMFFVIFPSPALYRQRMAMSPTRASAKSVFARRPESSSGVIPRSRISQSDRRPTLDASYPSSRVLLEMHLRIAP
jgi:hypothetical protein